MGWRSSRASMETPASRRSRFPQDGVESVDAARSLERRPAAHHRIKEETEAEDVASRIHLAASRLLGGHEGNGSLDGALAGRALERRLVLARLAQERTLLDVEELRESEVDELGVAFLGEHHVRGLDVAVHDPVLVGVGEARRDADSDPDRFGKRKRSLRESAREARASHQLHGDEDHAVGLVDLVDDADVGMFERCRRFGFGDESLAPFRLLNQFRRKNFEGDLPIQLFVAGAVDDLDFTAVELLEERVVGKLTADPVLWRVLLIL